jgi:transglutaminase-like putative cysteine protease
MKLWFRKSMMTYCAAGVILFVGAIFVVRSLQFKSGPPDTTIDIRYTLSVQNPTKHPIKEAKISAFVPVEQTGTQQCAKITASHAFNVQKDSLGNQSIQLQWPIYPPLSTNLITVQSKIQIWNKPSREEFLSAKDFLNAERYIESNDDQIRQQAASLKAGSTLQTAQNIFNWVAGHVIDKGYVHNNRGAVYALKYGKGDCTEFAFLFVALCRASGIPARPMAGFICSHSMVVDLSDYHNWAEFYLDGRWYIADPQYKRFMSSTPYYIAFQNIRPSIGLNGFMIGKTAEMGLKVKILPKAS